jgi:hypothetical protein
MVNANLMPKNFYYTVCKDSDISKFAYCLKIPRCKDSPARVESMVIQFSRPCQRVGGIGIENQEQ